MNPKRVFKIMAGLAAVLIVINVVAVYFGSSFLKSHSQKLSDLKLESSVLDEQQTVLNRAKKDIETYAELDKIAMAVVPQDKDQAEVVREIVAIAEKNGVGLASISFPASTLGQAAPKAAAPAEGEASTTPAVTTPPLTQVKPVEGIAGAYSLEITIQQDTTMPISYGTFVNFLSDLENNRRTAHVSNISVQPSTEGDTITFSLTLNAYIKP